MRSLLLVVWLGSAAGQTYVQGTDNTNVCPAGSVTMHAGNTGSDAQECCVTAAAALSLTPYSGQCPTDGSASSISNGGVPKGCLFGVPGSTDAGKIFFNGHSTGGALSGFAPVCKSSSGASGDPHFTGGDGDTFDFKGKNGGIYNLLSATWVTLNALFQHKTYHDAGPKHREVHGSYITAGFAAIKTNADRLLHIGYDATRAVFVNVAVNGTEPIAYKAPFSMTIDDVSVSLEKRLATITTPEWSLSLSSKFKAGIVAAGNTCADGKCFLEVKVSPRIDVAKLNVAPHGLIGQTYDGDDVGVIGKTDDYKTRDNVVTTSAMGEGAIEGDASDYEVPSKFATDFKFSRFGLTEAKPRDTSKLTGQKVGGAAKAASAGAA